MTDLLTGFDSADVEVDGAVIRVRTSPGEGTPVLLLHGFPQTHALWHRMAPGLVASGRPVVATDLRGYGASRCLDGDHSFRAMAADQAAVMSALGHDRFHLVGHDRGARTAHRLVLDHEPRVASLTLLDILPTLEVWATMDDWLALRYYHWLFLAQPGGLPERMIGADPVGYLHACLGGLTRPGEPGALDLFDPVAVAACEDAARTPGVVEGWCADYRAAAGIDLEHDRADAGRRSELPTLVLWGALGVVGAQVDPLAIWRDRFPSATGTALEAGHFLPEEVPEAVLEHLLPHLAAAP